MVSEGLTGVRFIDHTADVGIAVRAPSLELLFHRAALGMLALLRGWDDPVDAPGAPSTAFTPNDPALPRTPPRPAHGHESGPASEPGATRISASGQDREDILVAWLREILFLHETGWDYVASEFERLDPSGFRASVQLQPGLAAVREIKGVTHHASSVERSARGWTGRVIFDV